MPTTGVGDCEKFKVTPGKIAAGNAPPNRDVAPNVFTYHACISMLLGLKKCTWCSVMGMVCALASTSSTFRSSGPITKAIDEPPAGGGPAMSSMTLRSGVASVCVIIGYPAAFTLSIVARRVGTEKPMWLAVVPFVPPGGDLTSLKNTSTFGNLTISRLFVPILTAVPPSASMKNFFCASTFVVLMW